MSIASLEEAKALAEELDYRHNGLAIAVAQDSESLEVLMVAFMDKEAFIKTLTTGLAHYWSTRRRSLWMKGERSGHIQRVREVYVDCDLDTVLLKVEQEVAACHQGYRTCFYRRVGQGRLQVYMERTFTPEEGYRAEKPTSPEQEVGSPQLIPRSP